MESSHTGFCFSIQSPPFHPITPPSVNISITNYRSLDACPPSPIQTLMSRIESFLPFYPLAEDVSHQQFCQSVTQSYVSLSDSVKTTTRTSKSQFLATLEALQHFTPVSRSVGCSVLVSDYHSFVACEPAASQIHSSKREILETDLHKIFYIFRQKSGWGRGKYQVCIVCSTNTANYLPMLSQTLPNVLLLISVHSVQIAQIPAPPSSPSCLFAQRWHSSSPGCDHRGKWGGWGGSCAFTHLGPRLGNSGG